MRISQEHWEKVDYDRTENCRPGLGSIIQITNGYDIIEEGCWVDLGDPVTAHRATGRDEFLPDRGNPDDVCLGGDCDRYGIPDNQPILYVSCTLMDLYQLGWDVQEPAIKYHEDPGNDFNLPFDPVENTDALFDWMENQVVDVHLLEGNIENENTMYEYGCGVSVAHAKQLIMDHHAVGSWIDSHAPHIYD